jgi:glycerophosphoryl diester phosphodiesterase
VRDFDLSELRSLAVTERLDSNGQAVFPGRFPARTGRFRIHTLAEELTLVAGLNQATGKTTGVYPEIKQPHWHRQEGFDISVAVLQVLAEHGYKDADDPIFLQCFDAGELRRVRNELDCRLRLVQLIGENSWAETETDYDYLKSKPGLAELAETVDGIGPWVEQLYTVDPVAGKPASTGLTESAHQSGLLVHPFTFRADDLPSGFRCFEDMVRFFTGELGVDGLFSDFPDRVYRYLLGA